MSANKLTKINLWSTKHDLFRKYPFVRVLIIYACGILTSVYCDFSFDIFFFISALILIGSVSFFVKSSLFLSFISGLIVFATGCISVDVNTFLSSRKIALPLGEIAYYTAEVDQISKNAVGKYSVVLSQIHFKQHIDSAWKYYPEKVIATVDSISFEKGQYLLFQAKTFGFSPSKNPDVFDYAAMMSRKGIGANLFIYSDIICLPIDLPFHKKTANYLTAKITETVNTACKDKGAASVILAMILGKRDLVDRSQSKQFAYAGAMHLMAISGLHISILCGMLYFLFKPFRGEIARKISYLFILLMIWTYAYVLDFPVSVVRASTMLSVFLMGKMVERSGNSVNTLACAAFILIIIDPKALFDVGFQLSVMAVWGILVFYEPIYRLLAFKYTIIDYVWKTLAVSIAVQITTFPIAVYYFHFYPVYGIITNVFIIPLCTLVLMAGFIGISVSFLWSGLGVWIVQLAGYGTTGLNYLVKTAASMPYAIIDNVYHTSFETFCLLLFTICFVFAYSLRNSSLIYVAFISCSLYTYSRITNKQSIASSQEIVFFSIPNHTAFVYREGAQAYVCLDKTLKEDPKKISFSIDPYLKKRDLINHYLTLNDKPYYIIPFATKTILYVNDYLPSINLNSSPDYILLTNNAYLHIDRLSLLPCTDIILDSSNHNYYTQKTKKQLTEMGFNVIDLNEGAYVVNFSY